MAGDYNIALEYDKDTNGYINVNNPISRRYIKTWMMMNNLVDVWRERDPEKREYTFDRMQKKNRTGARLDFFLLSRNSMDLVTGGA